MIEDHIKFSSTDYCLEGMLSRNKTEEKYPAVIVCHPHPSYGGDMDNDVVYSICDLLNQNSIITLRFNFPGVCGSEGNIKPDSADNIIDIIAAIDYIVGIDNINIEKIGLAGYSFGGCAVLKAAPLDLRVQAVAAVSPFMRISNSDALTTYDKPKLFICGSHDIIVTPEMFDDLVRKAAEPKQSKVIHGASHFWMGYTKTAAGILSAFFKDVFTVKENGN